MGNNAAGHAIAEGIRQSCGTGKMPLRALDLVCEPWRGCDVDFDLTSEEHEALMTAIGEVFGKPYVPLRADEITPQQWMRSEWQKWRQEVYKGLFRNRYDFC